VPAALIGSTAFNRHPVALAIHGTRESARGLFDLLDASADLAECAGIFRHFMEIAFGLTPDPAARQRSERLRWRASYRKLLEGWGFDANSPQGAVLKGWVESRFGLVPTFHRAPLGRFPSPAWVTYIEEKMVSRFHGNCINLQLDLLYEFCQWCVRRFGVPARGELPVWRGVDSLDEHRVVEGSLRERRGVVHLNNLVSFSLSREHAGRFGDWILATGVPLQKLVFFPGLLGRSLLAGEGEVIALGGQYEVDVAYW
jgi:NAD+--dinitrogen-reductase ADP-D-ribosyltransferase